MTAYSAGPGHAARDSWLSSLRGAPVPFTTLGLVLFGCAGFFFGMPNGVLHLPLLALLYPCCLYLLARRAETGGAALRRGWLLGFAANTAGLYWLVFPLHDVAGIPFFLAVPAVLLLFSYFACYAALFALAARGIARLFHSGGALALLVPPLLGGFVFAGFEVWCGFLFTGFPWLCLGTAFGFSPSWLQAAALFGGFGLSALAAAAACLAAEGLLAPPRTRRLAFALGAALLTALPVYGLARLVALPETDGKRTLSVLMVQGNIDQNQKWVPAFQKDTLDLYMRLSQQALADVAASRGDAKPDLLLWPETAMPFYFSLHPDYAERLYELAAATRTHLAFGSIGVERAPGSPPVLKNRLYLLSPQGGTVGFYDKRHLVPFGEYLPFAANFPFLRNLLQGLDFSPGTVTGPLRIDLNGVFSSLGVLICYEAIFPALAQERVEKGADVLVNVSNDGWFRDSSAPRQHLAHVALRAVEQHRPMLRATNTGITAALDAHGRITAAAPGLFVATTLFAEVLPSEKTTVYHRLYPAPEIILAALAFFSLFSNCALLKRRVCASDPAAPE